MRVIDADKLYPDSVSIKGDRLCVSLNQIANAPTVINIEQIIKDISFEKSVEPHLSTFKKEEVKIYQQAMKKALDIIERGMGIKDGAMR